MMVFRVTLILLAVLYEIIKEGNTCPLNSPEVYVHFTSDHPLNLTRERAEFLRLMEKDEVSCTEPSTANANCCSCGSDDAYLCPSMTELNTLLDTSSAQSVFVGIVPNITASLKNVVQFDSWYSVAVSSMAATPDYYGGIANVLCQWNSSSGFVFRNVRWVLLENIELSNCGVRRHSVGFSILGGATILLDNSTITEIREVTINASIGSAIMFNSLSQEEPVELLVIGCEFHDNSIDDSGMTLFGGGVSIYISTLVNLTVGITDSVFYNNQANYGGSIALIGGGLNVGSVCLRVRDTNFTTNTAIEDGGVFYQLGLFDFVFENCMFSNNMALHYGGAIAIYGQTDPFHLQNSKPMVLDNCEFNSNAASSYAVLYLSLPIISMYKYKSLPFQLTSITMVDNYLSPEVYDSDNCILYFTNMDVLMCSGATLQYNRGSVVCLNNANLHLKDNVLFEHNFGYRGGAVNMQGLSLIHLQGNATVDFIQNTAVYGGAIYKGGDSETLYNHGKDLVHECTIFNFENSKESYPINFVQNSAKLGGVAIYVVNSEHNEDCEYQLQTTSKELLNLTENPNAVETTNLNISFGGPSIFNNSNGEVTLNISLGIYITLNTTITSFNQSSALFYVTLLKDGEQYLDSLNSGININGPTALSLSEGMTFTNFYFLGPEIKEDEANSNYSNFSLTFYLAENFNTNITVSLNFIPCKLGFEYNKKEKKCICVESSHLLCSERRNLACIEKGFWYGENGVVIPCYSGFCKNSYEACDPCALESGGTEYCKLQLSEDDECIDDRTSRACVKCRENYSYTYGAQTCINDDYCKLGKDIPIIIITSIVFLLLIMFMLYVMLKVENKKHFGYFYVVIYYYTVIGFVLPNSSLNSDAQVLIDSFIRSFVTLNPIFLGQFKVCFQVEHLVITLVNYIFPIAVCLLIVIQIKLSQRFSKYFNYQDNVSIRGICVLLLLSYGAILEASFNIINPVRYNNQTYVSIQPDIVYLGSDGLYIFSWICAMAFMVFFIIPLTIFLLFSPLIMRCFSMIRLRPFLDQFHACYKEEYRWMSGFYFMCRLVYFAIIVDPTTTEVSSYPYIRFLSVIIAIIHCLLQPYRSRLLNISDAIILVDIASLSLIHNSQNVVIFGTLTLNDIRGPITYILLNIPLLYLLALIIGFSFLRIKKFRKIVLWLKDKMKHCFVTCIDMFQKKKTPSRNGWERQIDEDSLELDFSLSAEFSSQRSKTVNDAAWFTEPREPLLSLMNNSNDNTTQEQPPPSPTESPLSTENPQKRNRVTIPPNFFEMGGDGVMSPGQRKGSFLVQYMKYRENSLNPNEIAEVTGE